MNKIRRIINFILFICLVLGFAAINSREVSAVASKSSFWAEFIDVGQGDATLIQCDGHYMLIDGGPADASSVIYTILKKKGIDKIDIMIATHPDADHIGGLSGALNYASVGVFYCPVTEHDTKTFNSIIKYLNRQKKGITVPKAGATFKLGSATVEILAPIEITEDTNNSSIVTKVTYGKNSILLMGDAATEEEKSLIKAKADLSCDILKIGHHGSASSTSEELLEKAKPDTAIISVGSKNRYGHPTSEALNRLKKAKVNIYRTDLQGDITCTFDGNKVTISTQKKADDKILWLPKDNNVSEDSKVSIPSGTTYVLNNRSKKIHLITCKSVTDMAAHNRSYSTLTKEELIAAGYSPCGSCHP